MLKVLCFPNVQNVQKMSLYTLRLRHFCTIQSLFFFFAEGGGPFNLMNVSISTVPTFSKSIPSFTACFFLYIFSKDDPQDSTTASETGKHTIKERNLTKLTCSLLWFKTNCFIILTDKSTGLTFSFFLLQQQHQILHIL